MPLVDSLDAIGLKYGTDKASTGHNYLEFYETFFAPLRNTHLTLLEIGVLNGASVKTWEEYFQQAHIIGADVSNSAKKYESNRISIEVLDQSNIEELTKMAVKRGPFDIIIEDGSHMWEHQITSLRTLFPFLKQNGIYVVEDLHTNYGTAQATFKGIARSSCIEFLKSWLDLHVADQEIPLSEVEDAFLRTYGRSVYSMMFYRRACLIKKRIALKVGEINAGVPLAALGAAGCSVAIRIMAHLSERGDVIGPSGYVNPPSDNYPVQGIAIATQGEILEYRVRAGDASWSGWVHGDAFAGSRGESRLLTGVTVRLVEHAKRLYGLRTFARFAGSTAAVSAGDGQDCTSPHGEPLCGLQVNLIHGPAGS